MKTKAIFLAYLAVLSLLMAGSMRSQQPTVPGTPGTVQQSPSMLTAATNVANCNVAVNSGACTATATPGGSNYVYVTAIDMEVCQDATGIAQTNVTWTTTNLTGAPIPWTYSTALAVQVCLYKVVTFNPAVKSSAPGSAVTVVSPAATLHTGYTANIFFYQAP